MIDPQHQPVPDTAPVPLPVPTLPPVMPANQVFLEMADNAPATVDVSPSPVPLRKRGPGFWESIAWMLGMQAVQVVASLGAIAVLVAAFLMTSVGDNLQGIDPAGIARSLLPYFEANLVPILGAAQLATVLFALLAIRLRFGAHGLRDLGFQRPWSCHWLLVALLMPPLWLLCSVLQAGLFKWFPNSQQEMQQLMQSMSQAPLSMLVLIIGLGPALGEELMFRGLIGRGLVARQGLVPGIFVTSTMFGLMHINPGQALAVIPIGLAMHFVYYTTRSFWAPVTLHLFNNSLSVILLKNSSLPAIAKIDQLVESQGGPPLSILVASAAMVTAIMILLWETRVQWVLPDGSVWDPGFATTSAPPPELGAVAVRQDPRPLLLAGSAFNSLGFAAGLWRLTGWAGLPF